MANLRVLAEICPNHSLKRTSECSRNTCHLLETLTDLQCKLVVLHKVSYQVGGRGDVEGPAGNMMVHTVMWHYCRSHKLHVESLP